MNCIKKHIKIIALVALNCLNTFGFSQNSPDSLIGILRHPENRVPNFDKQNVDTISIGKPSKDTLAHLVENRIIASKPKLDITRDSLSVKDELDSLIRKTVKAVKVKKSDLGLHGLISNQFDYGTVPYYIPDATTPVSLFKSQGDLNFSLKKIPFIFNYFYMNPANLLGLQNYYTFKFDHEKYQENLRNDLAEKKAGYLGKLKEAQALKQDYEQKLGYCESMNQQVPEKSSILKDTARYKSKIPNVDTISTTTPQRVDTVVYANNYKDSLSTRLTSDSIKLANDSNYKKIQIYKDKIEMYDSQIKEYDQKIKLLNDPKQMESIDNPYLSKLKNILGNVKRFEIGMCYPNYSTFLVNNLTLKGINAEYATSNYFLNFTYGNTINNLLNHTQTNNSIINSFQQTAGFFDLNRNQDSRKILSGKIGIGNKTTTYLGFGALYGVGKQNYLNTTSGKETNLVYELDGKIVLGSYVISASYAKSFINQGGTSENNEPLTKVRNNGLQLRFSGIIPHLKTKYSLGYRIVDPFFKSYGIGFIRTDNIRYEAKIEQVISSKLKIVVNYRRDEDNILNNYGFKSSLDYLSTSVKIKLFRKRLDINVIYTPIVQKVKYVNSKNTNINKSDMKNIVLSYSPRLKKVVTTLTGIYSQYSIFDGPKVKKLENFNVGLVNVFRSSFKIGANTSFYNSNISDSASLSPKTLLTALEVGYSFKKTVNTSLRFKQSYNVRSKICQYGIGFNFDFPIYKYFSMELHAEKLIIGDFYNSLNISDINQFPYYGYLKLNIKL